MKGFLYIGNEKIGEVKFNVIDKSMGVISGGLIPEDSYLRYKTAIQEQCEENGVSNLKNFNYRVVLDDAELIPEGGIGVTDLEEVDEIYVEVAGLHESVVKKMFI